MILHTIVNFFLKSFFSPDCESCFRNASGLDQHARHRHNKQPKKKKRVYQCSYCPKIFTTPEPMYAHANRYHLREVERDWHFDPVPKLYFPKRPEERRRATDSSIPRIYCEFCSANVTYIYVSHANKLHLEIISKVWLACDDCDQFFPNKNSLNGHKRCKHSKKEDVSGKKSSSDVAKRSFRCQFCQHNFGQAKVLYAHAARDHMELVSKLWHHCQVHIFPFFLPIISDFDFLSDNRASKLNLDGYLDCSLSVHLKSAYHFRQKLAQIRYLKVFRIHAPK